MESASKRAAASRTPLATVSVTFHCSRVCGATAGPLGWSTTECLSASLWISFMKRTIATPSPHECSKLIAALPLRLITRVNLSTDAHRVPARTPGTQICRR